MPALTKSTLSQLGADSNVIVSDMLYASSWISPVQFFAPSARYVTAVSQNTFTFSGGSSDVFVVGDYVTFQDDMNAYQIVTVTANTVTLINPPSSRIINDEVSVSINYDINRTSVQFRLQQYNVSGLMETRTGLDLGTVTQTQPPVTLNFDTYVQTVDITKGLFQINLAANAFEVQGVTPVPGDSTLTPIVFCGNLAVLQNQGPNIITQPASVDRLRMVYLIWSNLADGV